jgi:hypothetical protein
MALLLNDGRWQTEFEKALNAIEDDFAFYFHHQTGQIHYLTKDEFKGEFERLAERNVACEKTYDRKFNGRKVRIMKFTPKTIWAEKHMMMLENDPFMLMVFGIMSKGWFYVIPSKV